MADQPPGKASGSVSQDLLLELNFVPEWARKASGPNPYARHPEPREKRGDRRSSGRDRQRGQRDARGGPRDRQGGRRDRRDGRGRTRDDRRGQRPEREARPRPLDLVVRFLADREHLGQLVREITRSEKAYPIIEVASMMMQLPEHYLVKLESAPRDGKPALDLYQCKACQMVYSREGDLARHLSGAHLDTVFDVETVEGEPPSGNFVCVGRCSRTGTLLGPPNHHGYQQKVQEVVQSQFPHLSVAEYQKQIEMVHDPEVIEQWKQEQRTRTIYRHRGDADGSELSWVQARKEFTDHHQEGLMQKTHRAILPASTARHLEDASLLLTVRQAWEKESRFPLTMALAMRPAFRHMHLHLFKANRKAMFVTAVPPRPLNPDHAIPEIADLLRYLHDRPGCSRESIIHDLYPGASEESQEIVELNGRLRWLIERGHVIHFYNGALSVPTSASNVDGPPKQRRGNRNRRRNRNRRGSRQKSSGSDQAPPAPSGS